MHMNWSRADKARAARIIELIAKKAGSYQALADMVGGELTRQAVYRFKTNGKVPTGRCPQFVAVAEKLGVKIGKQTITNGMLNPAARAIEESNNEQ